MFMFALVRTNWVESLLAPKIRCVAATYAPAKSAYLESKFVFK